MRTYLVHQLVLQPTGPIAENLDTGSKFPHMGELSSLLQFSRETRFKTFISTMGSSSGCPAPILRGKHLTCLHFPKNTSTVSMCHFIILLHSSSFLRTAFGDHPRQNRFFMAPCNLRSFIPTACTSERVPLALDSGSVPVPNPRGHQ